MPTTITGIEAMTCARCATTVERAITNAGGTNATADWRTGSVRFFRDPATPIDRFRHELDEVGHPARDSNRNDESLSDRPRWPWIAGLLGSGGAAGLMVLCCAYGTAVVLGGIGVTAGAALRNPLIIALSLTALGAALLVRFRRRNGKHR
jgi:copper chaperone CopZ